MEKYKTIVKHATNEELLNSLILSCPYCKFYLKYNPENIKILLTHVRTQHLKFPFPIDIELTKKIHSGEAGFNQELNSP